METLTKENKKQILGSSFLLDNEVGLIAKLIYSKGIEYFDNTLNGKTQKEFKAVIHLNKFKKGVEIKLAKTFKSYSVGIQYDELKNIFVLSGAINKLKLVTNSNQIEFYFNDSDYNEIKEFFSKELKLIPRLIKNENEFEKVGFSSNQDSISIQAQQGMGNQISNSDSSLSVDNTEPIKINKKSKRIKKIIILAIAAILAIVCIITNPSLEDHRVAYKNYKNEHQEHEITMRDLGLLDEKTIAMEDMFKEANHANDVQRTNYLIFSLTKDRSETVGIGIFNYVWITSLNPE